MSVDNILSSLYLGKIAMRLEECMCYSGLFYFKKNYKYGLERIC